ncbi:hypothetical protein EV421DRAFT_966059 [Armillaria borealis]|uniref:Uncharacterized protein n=1 Tax=Armillaria borealis TaxID=47425 RepID=A0AA39MM45_9AGAR|nr:hypothetical protein EV421DRAFT_966059 [Armillaria borealis]
MPSKKKTSSPKHPERTKQAGGAEKTRPYASYKPPPRSNPVYPSLSLSEASGVVSDGRKRSSRQRVFLTKSRLEVPASDREKILFDVPVPQVGLPEMQPETEHTVLFATTITTMPRHDVCYSLTDALAKRRLTEPSAPAFGNLKIDGKSHFVWHLSWPGYNTRRTVTFSPEDVGSTRQDLAFFVACHVKNFIVECTTGVLKGACADPNWAITEDKTLDDFGISSFWTPDNATWRVTVTMKRDVADEVLFCVDKAMEDVAKGPQKTRRKKKARKAQLEDEYSEECYYYGADVEQGTSGHSGGYRY